MLRAFLLSGVTLAAAFALSSCSTVISGQTQEMTIETPGTENARCNLENRKFRYTVHPPRTFLLQRTKEPYRLECWAPGNRFIAATIQKTLSETYYLNITNAFLPGLAVDMASEAMFEFPNRVVVDFTGIQPTPMPLPEYQQLILKHPDLHGVEQFRPTVPYMQGDENRVIGPLQKNQRALDAEARAKEGPPADITPVSDASVFDASNAQYDASAATLGVDLKRPVAQAIPSDRPVSPVYRPQAGDTTESLNEKMNPSVFSGSGAYSMTPSASDSRVPAPAGANAGGFVGGTSVIDGKH